MTTADESSENLVDNLFREVDDHFADLERQYHEARSELATADSERRDRDTDVLRSAHERYELVSEVAALRSELARSHEALAERDRLLNELSERIGGFEAQIRAGEQASELERQARHELGQAKREVSRLAALLDARLAEREELSDLAHRLQSEKEHLEELLATALAKFEQVDGVRAEVTSKLSALESAREVEAGEYAARAEQLAELRSEQKRLSDQVVDLTESRDDSERRAVRFEGLVERRSNEINYLNRRLEALGEENERLAAFESEVSELRRENVLLRRRSNELQGEIDSQSAAVEASARAVETLAERSSERDEFADRIRDLEEQLEGTPRVAAPITPASIDETSEEIRRLTERIRNLETPRPPTPQPSSFVPPPEFTRPSAAASLQAPPEFSDAATSAPLFSFGEVADPVTAELPDPPAAPATSDAPAPPTTPDVPSAVESPAAPVLLPPPPAAAPGAAQVTAAHTRSRLPLPVELNPNTPEAVGHLLRQPGITAVIDARSSCSTTGMRPSELFNRCAQIRDNFDVPIEVVVTPVSTPIGGAPDLPAIGVHHVTGADTVADRIRALCIGFPADQPIVVITGDDLVRRAAITEEANVAEPAAVLGITTG